MRGENAPEGADKVSVHVIEIIEAHTITRHLIIELPVKEGRLEASPWYDAAKMLDSVVAG
ncbi:MAG: hypothetical protein ACOY30_00165 [Bacillota bacterium]